MAVGVEVGGIGSIGVVSPHYDDAVLSCSGALTPGSVVVTVFSGQTLNSNLLTDWDRQCGFAPGDDVAALRRAEDDDALACFGASGRALGLPTMLDRRASAPLLLRLREQVYHRMPRGLALHGRDRRQVDHGLVAEVCGLLAAQVEQSAFRTWLAPLGVCHFDHQLVTGAVLELARRFPDHGWFLYEDLPYAFQFPSDLTAAKQRVADAGYDLRAVDPSPSVDTDRKRTGLRCYRSQMLGMEAAMDRAIATPERLHALLAR